MNAELDANSNRLSFRSWLPMVVMILAAACAYPFFFRGGSELAMVVFVGSILSIASLIGTCLGIARAWWRFIVAPFAFLIPAIVLGFSFGQPFDWTSTSISGATSAIVFATLEIIKLFFGSFRIPNDDEQTSDGLQFGIAQLMIMTASVAVFITAIKFLLSFVGDSSTPMRQHVFFTASMFVSGLVVFTLANVWALMGSVVRNRLFIAIVASMVAISPAFFLAQSVSMLTVWVWLFVVCWAMIATQLWLLRRAGLRFVRK